MRPTCVALLNQESVTVQDIDPQREHATVMLLYGHGINLIPNDLSLNPHQRRFSLQ